MVAIPSVTAVVDGVATQVSALLRLPASALDAVEELRDAARSMRRVADRIDGVLDDVEQPARDLGPSLTRLSRLLDDPIVAEAPETLRRLRDEVLPAVRSLRETQQRVASIAMSTDRITSLIDETSGRLASLPGAAAMLMRRTARPPFAPPPSVLPGELPGELPDEPAGGAGGGFDGPG